MPGSIEKHEGKRIEVHASNLQLATVEQPLSALISSPLITDSREDRDYFLLGVAAGHRCCVIAHVFVDLVFGLRACLQDKCTARSKNVCEESTPERL